MALFVAGSHASAAEPGAADKETARRLMTEGRAHRKANELKEALQAFTAADSIMHVPTTGLEVAKSQLESGLLVEARDTALGVVRLPVEAREPTAFGEARAQAQAMAAEIQPRIPTITVKVDGLAPGAPVTVTVDGVEIPTAALGAPRAVDPGHHLVAAHSGGGRPKSVEVELAESDRKEVTLDVPPDTTPHEEAAETPTTPLPPRRRRRRPRRPPCSRASARAASGSPSAPSPG